MYEDKTVINSESSDKDFELIYDSWFDSRISELDEHNKMSFESERLRIQKECNDLKPIPWWKQIYRRGLRTPPKPMWNRLLSIEWLFKSIIYRNAVPYVFENVLAPFFFNEHPNGEIWFSKFDSHFNLHWGRQNKLFRNSGVSQTQIRMGSTPQSQTGLQFDEVLPHIGMSLPFILDFPYLRGISHMTMSGNFFFILDTPIQWVQAHDWNITDMLAQRIDYLYTDDLTPSRGQRVPTGFLEHQLFRNYLQWYIEHLEMLDEFVLGQTDDSHYFFLSYTLSRIMVESFVIQYSYMPFPRTITFFNLLDKYANLITGGDKRRETLVWKKLVDCSTYESAIRPLLESVDQMVGSKFADAGSDILGDANYALTKSYTSSDMGDVLRVYRNTHHGYLLSDNQKRILLRNTGNISNDLPDYIMVLWHALLQNPQSFIDTLT